MKIVVQKYGGSSVATVEKLRIVAERVVATKRAGFDVVVVVSAMGDTTDDLLTLARQVSSAPPKRELDMLLSAGERISMSLLSIAIHELGERAISFTGSQCGIVTNASHSNARIIDVRPIRVQDELEGGNIVIVAGYQGTSYKREITTLGRGGSDTTAVALAAALGAEHCDIFSDVDGVYSADPRVVLDAQRLDDISYEEMQELSRLGARVLNAQAVEFARRRQIAIYARATLGEGAGTAIRRVDGFPDDALEEQRANGVRGVTSRNDILVIEVPSLEAEALLVALDAQHVLCFNERAETTTVVLSGENIADSSAFGRQLAARWGANAVRTDLGTVSAVGLGVGDDPVAVLRTRSAIERAGVSVAGVFTARESVTALVDVAQVSTAVRAVHEAFLG
jgi:aspartate kinase